MVETKESSWGDQHGHTKLVWKRALEAESEWERDRFAAREVYQRRSQRRQPYRNGYYERDFVYRDGHDPAVWAFSPATAVKLESGESGQ